MTDPVYDKRKGLALLNTSDDPRLKSSEEMNQLLINHDGFILYNDKVFDYDKNRKILTELTVEQSQQMKLIISSSRH